MQAIHPRDADLTALRLFSRRVQVVGARISWRAAMQRRSTNVASVLRMMPGILGRRDVRRAKVDGAWVVTVDDVDVIAVVVRTPGRNVQQLLEPLPVRILCPERVALVRLAELERRGLAVIVAGGQDP